MDKKCDFVEQLSDRAAIQVPIWSATRSLLETKDLVQRVGYFYFVAVMMLSPKPLVPVIMIVLDVCWKMHEYEAVAMADSFTLTTTCRGWSP